MDVPEVEGGKAVVTADDVIVSERPREGWSVVNEQGETVALDLEITPELARAGQAVRSSDSSRTAARRLDSTFPTASPWRGLLVQIWLQLSRSMLSRLVMW